MKTLSRTTLSEHAHVRATLGAICWTMLLLLCNCALTRAAGAENNTLATPGVAIGPVKLGMTAKQVHQAVGNFDTTYTLPDGIKVERADWKEKGLTRVMMKVFYGKDGRVLQITSPVSSTYTKSGVTLKSNVGDISTRHFPIKLTEFRAVNGRVDYYDAIADGIAFEFRRLDEDMVRKMYAIVVHKAGKPVLSDQDEKRLK